MLVCSLPDDPIPGERRLAWVSELAPRANVLHLADPMPQEPSESPDFWDIWRRAIRTKESRAISFVFASEPYGERLAYELGARFIPLDVRRELVPISGTMIRQDPIGHWEYLPECVRPYFVKRVCLVGPESAGKSTLATTLARRFATTYAWEHARPLLDLKGGKCDPEDIPLIARSQIAIEEAAARRANRVLFCDTNVLLTKIWSEVLFGMCPGWIEHEAATKRYDLALLLEPDIPWVDDSQRYFPDTERRRQFFDRCRRELDRVGQPYAIISGSFTEREAAAIEAVRQATGLNATAK